MQIDEKSAVHGTPPLQYEPVPAQQHLPLRERALWIFYHLRLLNWWLFLLILLGFLGAGGLVWLQLRAGDSQGMDRAAALSRFVMEPGAGLLAGVCASSLLVGDPLLEAMLATRAGLDGVVIWRYLLTLLVLFLCSAIYLGWSLANGISYAHQQSPLYLLLLWLAPVLVMSMLSLFGALATRNAALGLVLAIIPLAGSLLLYNRLLAIQATHPFFLSYTYSGGQDAPDWWTNRLALLGIALVLACVNWWLLHREERLLGST